MVIHMIDQRDTYILYDRPVLLDIDEWNLNLKTGDLSFLRCLYTHVIFILDQSGVQLD